MYIRVPMYAAWRTHVRTRIYVIIICKLFLYDITQRRYICMIYVKAHRPRALGARETREGELTCNLYD